jgi:hypothetical protein
MTAANRCWSLRGIANYHFTVLRSHLLSRIIASCTLAMNFVEGRKARA